MLIMSNTYLLLLNSFPFRKKKKKNYKSMPVLHTCDAKKRGDTPLINFAKSISHKTFEIN